MTPINPTILRVGFGVSFFEPILVGQETIAEWYWDALGSWAKVARDTLNRPHMHLHYAQDHVAFMLEALDKGEESG